MLARLGSYPITALSDLMELLNTPNGVDHAVHLKAVMGGSVVVVHEKVNKLNGCPKPVKMADALAESERTTGASHHKLLEQCTELAGEDPKDINGFLASLRDALNAIGCKDLQDLKQLGGRVNQLNGNFDPVDMGITLDESASMTGGLSLREIFSQLQELIGAEKTDIRSFLEEIGYILRLTGRSNLKEFIPVGAPIFPVLKTSRSQSSRHPSEASENPFVDLTGGLSLKHMLMQAEILSGAEQPTMAAFLEFIRILLDRNGFDNLNHLAGGLPQAGAIYPTMAMKFDSLSKSNASVASLRRSRSMSDGSLHRPPATLQISTSPTMEASSGSSPVMVGRETREIIALSNSGSDVSYLKVDGNKSPLGKSDAGSDSSEWHAITHDEGTEVR